MVGHSYSDKNCIDSVPCFASAGPRYWGILRFNLINFVGRRIPAVACRFVIVDTRGKCLGV